MPQQKLPTPGLGTFTQEKRPLTDLVVYGLQSSPCKDPSPPDRGESVHKEVRTFPTIDQAWPLKKRRPPMGSLLSSSEPLSAHA